MAELERFLEASARAAELLAAPEVATSWERASALEGYTVAGLAGHLARAVLTVERYLGAPAPDPATPVTDASGYLAAVLGDADPVDSELHRSVRARGVEASAAGPGALADQVTAATSALRTRLDPAALARPIAVLDGVVLTVASYLETRLIELVVHADDLAVSVGVPVPAVDEETYAQVAAVLARVAARRTGGLDAVRALSRAERHPGPLRAL